MALCDTRLKRFWMSRKTKYVQISLKEEYELPGSSQVTELLLSLRSSSCSDLPYRNLVASDWWEAVGVHCQWHDMWICPGLRKRHSLIKLQALFVFQRPRRNHYSGRFLTHITVSWRLQCAGMWLGLFIYTFQILLTTYNYFFSHQSLRLCDVYPPTNNLFTGSKVFFFSFSNDRMQNGAHQQHSQTLQSVTAVSVLEQEREKKQRQENWSWDCRRDLHWEACEILYWHTVVSCESKNLRLQLYHGNVIALLSVCGKMMSLPISCVFGTIAKNHSFL